MPIIDKTGLRADSSAARIRKIRAMPAPPPTSAAAIRSPADLGMGRIELMLFTPATNGTLFTYPVWVPSATGGTVKWLVGTTGVEVAGGVNLSAYTARFEAIGK
jgi:hypothetical protein